MHPDQVDRDSGARGQRASATGGYSERLSAPASVWVTAYAVTLGVVPICLPLMPLAATATVTAVAYVVVTLAVRSWAAPVVVAGGELRAGRARIPVGLLGEPAAHDPADAARLRGRDIQPQAYHLIRPWIQPAVTVGVGDPADPTPYWYVGTRHPEALAAAIRAAKAQLEGAG